MLRQLASNPNCKSSHKGLLLISRDVNSFTQQRDMSKNKPNQQETEATPIGEISQEPSALDAFLDANQKKLIIIGIVGALALVLYVIISGLSRKATADDSAAAAAAFASGSVPELDAASKELSGTPSGGSTLLQKATLLWQDQQQDEAVTTLEAFLSEYPDHPAHGSALARLGSYQQDMGKTDDAKSNLEKAVATNSAASSTALIALGDIALLAGDIDTAKANYERVATDFPKHLLSKGEAKSRLKLVGVEAPTEKAAPPTPTPGSPNFPTPGAPNFPTPGSPSFSPGLTPTSQPFTIPPTAPTPGTAPNPITPTPVPLHPTAPIPVLPR